MRAIVKAAARPGVAMQRLPVPEPGPEEVLVRVKAAAVCGTDLHIAHWNAWAQGAGIRLPLVLGHEFSGEVVGIGSRVRALAPGDYVAGETHIPCGECYQCRNGLQHICKNLKLFGVHRDGCFAEYATIPALCAYKVPAAIPPRVAAMLEPLGTSLRAVLELDVSGGSVVVIGCGPIGLFAVASAKALGASRIIGLDVREERLALAKRLGCDITLNPRRPDTADQILEATEGVGADAIVEASGNAAALEGAVLPDRSPLRARPAEHRAGRGLQRGHHRRHPRTGDVPHLDADAAATGERPPERGSGRDPRDSAR
jgi:threonine 3-dehydrogenase